MYDKKVYPVIHVRSAYQCMTNLQTARVAGADGVFLISHGMVSDSELVLILKDCWEHIGFDQQFRLGINALTRGAIRTLAHPPQNADMLWADDGINAIDPERAALLKERKTASGFAGDFYGGVAFKGQAFVQDDDLPAVCRIAMTCMDVVTTSGPRTGMAANPRRIRIMHEALEGFPLAIASGIAVSNVRDYLPYARDFLVSTSISDGLDNFVLDEVRRLVGIVHAYA